MAIIIDFIDRSMDYIERQLNLLKISEDVILPNADDDIPEFSHVRKSANLISRFIEGSDIYKLFTYEEINKFVSLQLSEGTWDFIHGLQQYTYAAFTINEIADIIDAISFCVAPNKVIGEVANSAPQSPTGIPVMDNTPVDISAMLRANLWLVPLVALGLSRDFPLFVKAEDKNG